MHEDARPLRDLDDDALMARIDAGLVEDEIGELQARYGARLRRFVRGFIRDEHLLQDVIAEVFERVFLKSSLYRQGSNFRAWLFEVARNQSLSTLRARRRSPRPVGSLGHSAHADDRLDPLDALADWHDCREPETRELLAAFEVALAELPDHYRRVFELCEQQGLTYAQAAAQLGTPTGTIAIRLMRARRHLFRVLSPHLGRLRRPPACFQ